jgi:Bacterial Ig-like domain (group 3)
VRPRRLSCRQASRPLLGLPAAAALLLVFGTLTTGGSASAGTTAAPSASSSVSGSSSSQSFAFDDTPQFFTVPTGVSQVHLVAWGGSGGNGGYSSGEQAAPGGLGAELNLDAPVGPGDTLVIEVGGQGDAATGGSDGSPMQSAGAGGGSSGSGQNGGPGGNINFSFDGSAGGGGGGGTVILDTTSGTTLLDAAGGGGGGGGPNGGDAGIGFDGGAGGSAGSPTNGDCTPTEGDGYNGSGPTGGSPGGLCSQSGVGPAGISGSGETPLSQNGTSGGGGGGAIGGTGGGNASFGSGGGGGAAGTSTWSAQDSDVQVSNAAPGNGGVTLSWTSTPAPGFLHMASFTCCSVQSFTVPAGVTQLQLTGWGGTGGAGGYSSVYSALYAPLGGFGAEISLDVPVDPGDQLVIGAGGQGASGSFANNATAALAASSGGTSDLGQSGGAGGGVTVTIGSPYSGGTGGGGGGATEVVDQTTGTVLIDAGGGGGGGGDYPATGNNGGFGADAGSPAASGDKALGDGHAGSGPDIQGSAGGLFAPSGQSPTGGPGASDTGDAEIGTGGGGGGGTAGGTGGGLCTLFNNGGCTAGGGGGGGAGGSSWIGSASNVIVSNSLAGGGGVTISYLAQASTSTDVVASANPVDARTPVTFTASVSSTGGPAGALPTGTVTFVDYDTGLPLGLPISLSGTGPETAVLTTSALPAGTDQVYASYSGDSIFGPSTSALLAEEVTPATAYTVAAEGTDGALWAQSPQLPSGWQSLGGQLLAAPAVAAVPEASGLPSPLFIATGTDHSLWIRSLDENWTSLTPGLSTYCLDSPAAVVIGPSSAPTLSVACEGSDHGLYAATVAVPSSGLPTVSAWTSLGGDLGAGPAVAPVNGVLTYFVTAGFNDGQVWTRTVSTNWGPTSWHCVGHPAAGIAQGGTTTFFGCEGTDGQLWAGPLSGVIAEGGAIEPGVALGITSGGAFMFAEASFGAHSVWFRTPTANWASLGGSVVNGVGAVGLD